MNITLVEMALIEKYLNTNDKSIIQHVIEHPWAYSGQMVQIAIAIDCDMFPKRMVCDNSILIKKEF